MCEIGTSFNLDLDISIDFMNNLTIIDCMQEWKGYLSARAL